ncbi:MAG: hypothetical protein LBF78_15735 [Treponema sp.]|jgi:hypothetical protein|nr:hypothetical protein [Treponema sp.]
MLFSFSSDTAGPPVITEQPKDITARIGQDIGFVCKATGGDYLGYSWTVDGVSFQAPGGDPNEAYGPTFRLTLGTNAANGNVGVGTYTIRVTVSNTAGSVLSREATLTVEP